MKGDDDDDYHHNNDEGKVMMIWPLRNLAFCRLKSKLDKHMARFLVTHMIVMFMIISAIEVKLVLKVKIETGQTHGGGAWRRVCDWRCCLCLSQEVLGKVNLCLEERSIFQKNILFQENWFHDCDNEHAKITAFFQVKTKMKIRKMIMMIMMIKTYF